MSVPRINLGLERRKTLLESVLHNVSVCESHRNLMSMLTPESQCSVTCSNPGSGELRTQKLKSHLVRTQSFNVLPLKPGVGQYTAIHATLTARDFFLAYFYPSGPFTCIFFQNLTRFFLCWLWLTHGSCIGPRRIK